MKKTLSIGLSALIAVCAFATGAISPNTPQSGVVNYDATTTLAQTITFSYPFTVPPAVIANGLQTNNNPFTVSAVTISNFVLTVTTSASTNASVAWQAYAPYPRLQYGAAVNVAGTVTNVAFPFPYVFPPTISVEGANTNANAIVAITAITTTNFSILCNVANTNNWQATGPAFTPGANSVTY